MLLTYSKIVGAKVVDLKTQTVLGNVFDLVIQKNDISVSGIILRNDWLSRKTRVISHSDVVEITHGAVIVKDDEVVTDLSETIRLKESVEKGFCGIGQTVVTKSGKRVGKVFDFVISTDNLSIVKFYIRSMLAERIIPVSMIISYDGKKIVVKDEFASIKIVSPAIESSVI